MSTRHSELRLQGTLEPAFLPLNWKIQTGIHIKPIPADLLLLAPGLAVERDGAGLSPHIVGIFELLGQAQYPQERREVLRGNLLKGYLQLIAELVDQQFCIAALPYGLLKFFLHIIQRGLRVGGGLVLAVCFPDTLRHFYATYLLQEGTSKQVAASLLGHADTAFLAKYIEHWVADVGPKKLADSTYQRDLQDIRRILPTLGNYKLTDLRKEVIRDFYEEMRHTPRLDGRGNLSEKSVEGLHNTLCGILSAAVDEGYLTHNPAWRCYKPKGQKKERPVADEETVKKLITAFEGQSMKYETYFKLVLATGLRRGEACGLKWSDINWRKRTIHVQRGVVKLSHQESITKDPKTTSGDRMVYLSKEMCQLLKAWRKECEWDRQQTANETVNEDDYLFRQPNGKPMNPCTFTYRFKLILKANNLPLNLNVHSLRHTNASLLIAQGVDVRTVASLLGHAQASTTLDIYAHAFDKNKRKAQEKLGKTIGL